MEIFFSSVKHTVVISDVHLCEAVEGDGLWMRYRHRRFFPDDELRKLFELLCSEARGGELELVFNGDLFDFDALGASEDGDVRFDDPPRSESVAVDTLSRILTDHDVFVSAVGRVLREGHRVVFISGNHDAQLVYPRVRALLVERLVSAARAGGATQSTGELRSRVVFRTWFHRTREGIHIEHGNQYDRFCSFSSPMEPFGTDGETIQPTVGSLSFRHLVGRMGYFNPHVDSSFMLSLPGYLSHWARYYLFSQRSLVAVWATGALRVAAGVMFNRRQSDEGLIERTVTAAAREVDVSVRSLVRHAKLFAPSSGDVPHAVMRELWLDRFALGALGMGAVLAAAVGGPLAATKLAVGAAGAITAYELVAPKPTFADTYDHVARCAEEIAWIHNASAVVFGHTHQPYGRWKRGVFLGNSGTWSVAFRDIECTVPAHDGRPVIWLRSKGQGKLEGGLYTFRAGHLVEDQSHHTADVETPLEVPAAAGIKPSG